MYDDPLLMDHEIARRQYELSNGIQPVSIRDQILRSAEIVTRLIAYNVIARGTGRLLVVGGGVAGFSAAFEAISHNVAVTLLEANATHFSLFAACFSRRVDPTFYDWPLPHWRTHTFSPTLPRLAFTPKSIDLIVQDWQKVIRDEKSNPDTLLEIRTQTRFVPTDITLQNDTIHYNPSATATPEIYDAVLYAAGMGEERVWLDDPGGYYGPRFWHPDELDQRWCGKPTQPAVLIAGSGDGALQDYIRILTGLHPAEVLEKIDHALASESGWQKAQFQILAAQDKAARQFAMGCKSDFHKTRDKATEEELHQEFVRVVQSLFTSYETSITAVLDPIIKSRKSDLPDALHLLISGEAFTWCYAANRFLVLLLNAYLLVNMPSNQPWLGKTLLYNHILEWTDGTRVRASSKAERPRTRQTYDIVIIRFGINRSDSLCPSGKPPRQRSMMPYEFVKLSP